MSYTGVLWVEVVEEALGDDEFDPAGEATTG
jgi:hypothetical protein